MHRTGDGWAARCAKLLVAWAHIVRASKGWRRHAIAFISGALSVLSLAPFFLWPVLFFTVPNLVWLVDGEAYGADRQPADKQPLKQRVLSASIVGWAFGFGYFSAGMFWIGEAFLVQADIFVWALPFAVTLLPAGLALFFALAAGSARLFWRPGVSRVFMLAVTLTSAEWLRGHVLTGLPWNTLGYAFTAPLELLQMVSVIGVYGLTLWVVSLAAVPAVMAADALEHGGKGWQAWHGTGIAALVLAAFWAYGAHRLANTQLAYVDDVAMRVVQASIPQREKWLPGNQERIFADHLNLSRQPTEKADGAELNITHIVWPEVAMPFLPLELPVAAQRIAEMLPENTYLISGALRRDPIESANRSASDAAGRARQTYNSMLVFNSDGQPVEIYDKIHLVPFGEYLPFQEILESIGLRQLTRLRGGFTPGRMPRPLLDIGAMRKIAGLICYEAIFPGEIGAGAASSDRPQLYINVTNDGWFGNTTGPRQHFQQARARAVETGISLLRSANNGISAMIGPSGRVLERLELNQRGVIDTRIPRHLPPPIYARFGDWTLAVLILVFLSLSVAASRHRPHKG